MLASRTGRLVLRQITANSRSGAADRRTGGVKAAQHRYAGSATPAVDTTRLRHGSTADSACDLAETTDR